MPSEAPQALVDVIESCLDSDPNNRPTGRELVSMLTQIASNDSYNGISSQARCRCSTVGWHAGHSGTKVWSLQPQTDACHLNASAVFTTPREP